MRTKYDAVIVGGGHNGLVAAAYLAGAGQQVLLLERNATLGGATASQRVFPDHDALLSRYAYLISLFPERIVEELDLRFTLATRRIASCTPYVRDGRHAGLLVSNVDEEVTRRSVEALAGSDGYRGYLAFQNLVRTLAGKIWPGMLAPLRTKADWRTEFRSPTEREAWHGLVEEPLGRLLERYVADDVLRGLLFTDAKIGVLTDPDDETLLQNRCFLYHVIGKGDGMWRVPVGGMRSLVDALAERARHFGAELHVGCEVTAVHVGATAHSVTFVHEGASRTVDATRVLVNATPRVFHQLLGTAYQPAQEDEGSVVKVNMLLRKLPPLRAPGIASADAFAGSFHVDEGYAHMRATARAAREGRLPDQPPFELYCHTLTDDSILGPELRAAGWHTLTLFGLDAPYRAFAEDAPARGAEMLQRYFAGLNAHLAEPIEDCLARDADGGLCVELKTPQDLEREVGLDLGNIFHRAPSWFYAPDDSAAGRWGVETELPRVYRCGSSALRGGAVSGIPGHNAARCIFEELGIRH